MARPKSTTEGRSKPIGDSRVDRRSPIGLTFTRVPKVRRLRQFPAAPRPILQITSAEESREERYQVWFAVWGGTRPEWTVFDYLVNVKGYKHGVDFAFQSSFLGGRQRLGGSIVDFEVYKERVFLRVQGERFHLGPETIARDTIQKIALSRTGYVVVDVWAEQVIQAPRRVIEAALRGITLRAGIN